MCGGMSSFHRFTFPLMLGSMALILCKIPLLLLGIIGLAATILKFKEGKVALSIYIQLYGLSGSIHIKCSCMDTFPILLNIPNCKCCSSNPNPKRLG